MAGLLYKPFGLLFSFLAGFLAGKLFERIWALFSDEPPPDPDDQDARWGEVLGSAVAQGAVFSFTQALVQRGGATWFWRATGAWPVGDG